MVRVEHDRQSRRPTIRYQAGGSARKRKIKMSGELFGGFLRRRRGSGLGGRWGNCRRCRRASNTREGSDDFLGGAFADLTVAIVNAALRESVLAAASASFGVEFVEGHDFLFRRKFRKIDPGELGGADGVLDEDLAGVVESFYLDVADGQAEERADF